MNEVSRQDSKMTPDRQHSLNITNSIFKSEQDTVEQFHTVLLDKSMSYDTLLSEYRQLGQRYESLLKQATKLTRIGDVAQRRLMNAQKEMEYQNMLLDKQSRDIEKANSELQEKNSQLNETLTEIELMNDILEGERRKAENLLLNILPSVIAYRLQSGEEIIADKFDDVTVLFADIVGFTELSARVSATTIVKILNDIFSRFDALLDNHNVEKIKTIGDCYMLAAGIPVPYKHHMELVASMAFAMNHELENYVKETGHQISMRIGLHSGPVVAGIIGTKKFVYDLWGDTVNTASRMESSGVAGRIHCSEVVYANLNDKYIFEERGTIEVKGKGTMMTYFLIGAK